LDQEFTSIWWCSIRILKECYQADVIAPTPNHKNVTIQWAPLDDDSHLDTLRIILLQDAHHICMSLLIKYGYLWCTSCPPSQDDMRLLVDAPELINTFRTICPVLFYADPGLREEFLGWLDAHAPKAVQEAMVSRESPISQLDTKRLFRSIRMRPWCWYAVSGVIEYADVVAVEQDDNTYQWSHVKGEFRSRGATHSSDLMEVVEAVNAETSKQCMIRVVGIEPSGLCAVVGPFDAKFGYGGDAFYVFPYPEI